MTDETTETTESSATARPGRIAGSIETTTERPRVSTRDGDELRARLEAWFAARPEIEHPSELSFFLKLTDEIVTEPLTLHDGWLDIAMLERVRVDPDRLRRLAVD